MNKENVAVSAIVQAKVVTTRSQVNKFGTSGGNSYSMISQQHDQKRVLRACSSNTATKEKKSTLSITTRLCQKRKAVLAEVTNVCSNSAPNDINNATIKPGKKSKPPLPKPKPIPNSPTKVPGDQNNSNLNNVEVCNGTTSGSHNTISVPEVKDNPILQQCNSSRSCISTNRVPSNGASSTECTNFPNLATRGHQALKALKVSRYQEIIDIDSRIRNPQMCSDYATEIYDNLRVAEHNFRLCTDFMHIVQHEINQSMRGILIDWLVDVCEEYKLVPDTLYLAVNLIDRFLSEMPVEKQKLQLIGITCLLIASKYEEICAAHVEELCFVTDNTYTKAEVIKTETQIITLLNFRLSVPTIKPFLRRFIHAAQASSRVDPVKLEFLANYLAELTLIDYTFLEHIPSTVAASAVFLAKWTLDHTDHPWNPTLECYTSYSPSQLKDTVLAMQELQENTCRCSLTAIREKYKQDKFKCVANLFSMKSVGSLF